MLDREACRRRVRRLLESVREEAGSGNLAALPQAILISRPEHLLYLANVAPLPTTLNHRAPSFLLLDEDGSTTLFTDNWFGPPPDNAADEVVVTDWYNMKMPALLRIQAVAEVVREHLERCGITRLAGEAGALLIVPVPSVAVGSVVVPLAVPFMPELSETADCGMALGGARETGIPRVALTTMPLNWATSLSWPSVSIGSWKAWLACMGGWQSWPAAA